MISVNECYLFVQDVANKFQTGADFTPDQFNRYLPIVVNEAIRKYYGKPENYRVGSPVSNINYEQTQLVRDYLQKIKVRSTPFIINKSGELKLPDNYLHYSSLDYYYYAYKVNEPDGAVECTCHSTPCTCNKTTKKQHWIAGKTRNKEVIQKHAPIKVVTDDQWAPYLNDSIRKPNREYPIAKFDGDDVLVFAPYYLKKVYMSYLRYPKKPFWNSTESEGVAVYQASGSQDIEMPEIMMKEIAMGVLDLIGINTREEGIIQYAKNYIASGV